jgi:hypothetical protein
MLRGEFSCSPPAQISFDGMIDLLVVYSTLDLIRHGQIAARYRLGMGTTLSIFLAIIMGF